MAAAPTNTPPAPPAGAQGTAVELRDIRPPVEIPSLLPWVLGLIAALGAALVAWWWIRRRQRLANRPAPAPAPLPPAAKARRALEMSRQLLDAPKPFCLSVSWAVRAYIEERFDCAASDRTTEEFLPALSEATFLNADQKSQLAEFLGLCDMVKFAREEPPRDRLEALLRIAHLLVDETDPDRPRPPGTAPIAANAGGAR